ERARPGGRVAVTVWARDAVEPLPELFIGALPDNAASGLEDLTKPAIEVADTPGSLAHWLTDLGLVDVRAEAVRRHLDLSPELAWQLVLGTALRVIVSELDDAALEGVRERFLAAHAAGGVASVDVTTLIAVGRRPG
ncbi:MAG TPA: hypothetical protein VFG92_09490, partial [Agromyces sp.]|nr:hypothetical protein [Agromyces sp.]